MTHDAPADLLPPFGHLVIFGVTGSGKSSLVRSLSRGRLRVLVVDPHDEYGSVAVQVHSPEELREYLNRAAGKWRIAYFNDHLEDDFPALCNLAYSLGNVLFVIDEADWWCSPHDIVPEYGHLIKYGRHPRVQVASISRMPAEVNRLVTSQAAALFCFLMVEPVHLEYIGQYAGKQFAAALPVLPLLHCRVKYLHDPRAEPMLLRVDPKKLAIERLPLLTGPNAGV